MKQGSIQALGYEAPQPTNLLVVVPFVGLVQAFAITYLLYYFRTSTTVEGVVFWLLISSWIIFFVCAAVFAVVIWQRIPPGPLDLRYEDRRDEGGELKVSYNLTGDGKKRMRTSLVVKRVKAFPDSPLSWTRAKLDLPVKGTKASNMIIIERPKVVVWLGFPSVEEMNSAYELLK